MAFKIPRLSRKTFVFVITIQWAANPIVPVVYLRTKDRGMISSIHIFVMYISFRRSSLDLFQILIIIIRP
jgi:hypothetical protein